VIISFGQKIGIVCLRSLEEYIVKNKIIKCYVIASSTPHQNVINYARKIDLLEIIISSNFKQEVEKIRKLYKDTPIKIIDLADFGERNMMRDVD
jgi:cellobiose-specific phosphotransferase system component IIB